MMYKSEWFRRIVGAGAVWLFVSVLAFTLGALAPGDPAQIILLRRNGEAPSETDVRALRLELGLNDPAPQRYARWVRGALVGDFGTSYRTGQPVFAELRARAQASLLLASVALLIGMAVAVPLALLSVAHRGATIDRLLRVAALTGISIPSYLVAYVLILIFAVRFRMLPAAGAGDLRHALLPALTLGLVSAAGLSRILRANLLDEVNSPYMRTALAKGVSGWKALVRHALRNALNPLVTVGALRFGRILGEAVIIETVFAWPGVGLWTVAAIYDRDYPAIQAFMLFVATLFIVINLLVDVAYGFIDPRVRVGALTTARS